MRNGNPNKAAVHDLGLAVGNLLVEAEGALLAQEAYIPLGAPVRWSLVRGGLEGFSENPWARHPLYALAGVEAW